MIHDDRTSEEIAQDFRWGRPIRHCPGCGELAISFGFSRLDSFFRPFGDSFPETGVTNAYCANCDAFLDVWGRGKGDGKYELSCRMWRWNDDRTQLTSNDPLFEHPPPPNPQMVEAMTEIARENALYVAKLKWDRQQRGPRFQKDDPKFTVHIPRSCAQVQALEDLIQAIRNTVRNQRAGRFLSMETVADGTELHFKPSGPGGYIVTLMWESNELPAAVTLWYYNAGLRYQSISWDLKNAKPTIHPSLLPPDKHRPKATQPATSARLPKKASVEESLDWLCARLGEIEAENPELTDTAVRENIFDALDEGFLRPNSGAVVPKSFGMDSKSADLKISRALTAFLQVATPAANSRNLSPQRRIDLIKTRPFDGYLGSIDRIQG